MKVGIYAAIAITLLALTASLTPLITQADTVSPSAMGFPQIPRVEVQKLASSLYVSKTFAFGIEAMNNLFLVGNDGILLVDGIETGHYKLLRSALSKVSKLPVKYLINTHWHHDHTGINQDFFRREATTIIAHEGTQKALARAHHLVDLENHPSRGISTVYPALPDDAQPTILVKDNLSLNFENTRIEIVHYPQAHSGTDLVIRFPSLNVIHLGDVFFNGVFPMIDRTTGGSIDSLIATCEMILTTIDDNTIVIPAHGPIGNKNSLMKYVDMLKLARERIRDRIQNGETEEEVISARPLADLEAQWSWFFIPTPVFTRILYRDLR